MRAPRVLAGRGQARADDSDLELRKITLEHDRGDQEAVRAHERDLEKMRLEQANTERSEEITAARTFRDERLKAALAVEDELSTLYHQKVAEVAIAGIDRSRDSAKFVQTAATAILGIYTGLLALTYSVTDNPLPLRGAWAGVFLGLSIAFATAYLAFITDVHSPKLVLDQRSLVQRQYSRTAYLTKWIRASVRARRYAVRAAVLSLLFGVLFIAAPFVSTVAPVPDVPEPTVPTVPGEVAPGFESTARTLFDAQVEDYEAAVAARAAALEAAEQAATDRASAEDDLDAAVSAAAAVALVVVVMAPLLLSAREEADEKAAADGSPAPPARGRGR